MNRVVIVGASTAGVSAAKTLREEGFEGTISVVEPERSDPYDRTTLSKELILGRVEADRIRLLEPAQLEQLGLDRHRGRNAVGLNISRRIVVTDDGDEIPYDGVVIATGSSARPLPLSGSPRGVVQLRTLDDALTLRSALAEAERVILIGGGFVGLEIAAAAASMGRTTTVIEAGSAPLAQALGTQVGHAIAKRHEALGVEILTDDTVTQWLGSPELRGVRLASGRRISADVAVVGVGAIPNTQWLADTPLGSDVGILCDETLATAVPEVVAAGDVARWHHPLAGHEVRVEHFEHAGLSGAHAARRLLHGPDVGPYAPVPFVWSHQGPHTVHVAGFPSDGASAEIVEGDLDDGSFAVSYRRADGSLVGILTLDMPSSFRRLRRQLSSQGVLA
jgi:NADPH-dependent 2,4-dienoyl-CoA reductase/sulfur reductase-like enzyme